MLISNPFSNSGFLDTHIEFLKKKNFSMLWMQMCTRRLKKIEKNEKPFFINMS